MERLTERSKNGLAMAACCGKECEYNYVCEDGGTGECRGMDDIIDRLAAIEDILGDDYDLDRLRELVEADKDGRCVVLPCKVGEKIYKLFCGGAVKLEVERIVCWSRGRWKVNANTDKKYRDWKGFEIDFSDFGKTVFLTRESAEAALKGEQDG